MEQVKERIKRICKCRGIPISTLLRESKISSSDYYSAINCKRPFYQAWRKRIADVLGMGEEELFPEYQKKGV